MNVPDRYLIFSIEVLSERCSSGIILMKHSAFYLPIASNLQKAILCDTKHTYLKLEKLGYYTLP